MVSRIRERAHEIARTKRQQLESTQKIEIREDCSTAASRGRSEKHQPEHYFIGTDESDEGRGRELRHLSTSNSWLFQESSCSNSPVQICVRSSSKFHLNFFTLARAGT